MTAFDPLFVPGELREAVGGHAWLDAMLDVERALANAESLIDVVPAGVAAAIAEQCDPSLYDVGAIMVEGRASGNPVEPLVRALKGRVGGDAARYVHFGATSQDVLDTAMMLIARSTVRVLRSELRALAVECARLAREHRSTPIAGRTLLQQAVPTTFGAKVATWLVAVLDARAELAALRFPAQLGGAAGTLAALGPKGLDVLAAFAAELELDEPVVPWHTQRAPITAVAVALGGVAAAAAKIGGDVVLLAQAEVGEVAERDGGPSSTMPHKRNPIRAVLARACARIVIANAHVLTDGVHEHERAAGAWHSEWPALSTALAFAGASAVAARECLERLDVDTDRMRANMTPELYSERDRLGLDDPQYLGSAAAFVDRALARFEASDE